MRWLLLLALLSLTASADDRRGRFERFCSRADQGRSSRGFLCDDYAFFEFAPASGAGMPAACSSTAPTGAKGEALTFSRGSGAVCTKTATGGLAMSGIADGDLVEVSSNVVRVEYDSGGALGIYIEPASAQNVLTRFIDYANASWSDVGTPTLTGSQASPFSGTYATSAVRFDDNDAAAFEGRSIPITVSAGSAYWAHCYVKGGTATSARIVLDGTAATITGLSTTTWSVIEVGDASASAASISFEVDVGSTAAATGTVIFGGCQVELGTAHTAIIPTVAAAVTRSADSIPQFAVSAVAAGSTGSFALSIWPHNVAPTTGTWLSAPAASANPDMMGRFSAGSTSCYARTTGVDLTTSGLWLTGSSNRLVCTTGRLTRLNASDGTTGATTLFAGFSTIAFGNATFGAMVPGIYSRICFDPADSRCR